jgi:hypothetical protein
MQSLKGPHFQELYLQDLRKFSWWWS